jgi:hypothetical protein
MAAPALQTAAGCRLLPAKQANSRYTSGITSAHRLPLQQRKANATALHDGCLMAAAIAQSMRGDIHFAPEDSTIVDRVIGRLSGTVRAVRQPHPWRSAIVPIKRLRPAPLAPAVYMSNSGHRVTA